MYVHPIPRDNEVLETELREQGLGLVQMFLGRVGRRLLERLAGAQWCKTDCAS